MSDNNNNNNNDSGSVPENSDMDRRMAANLHDQQLGAALEARLRQQAFQDMAQLVGQQLNDNTLARASRIATNILSTPTTAAGSVLRFENVVADNNSSWRGLSMPEIDGGCISANGVSFKDIIADVKALQAEVKALKAEIKILQLRLPVPESARKFIRRV